MTVIRIALFGKNKVGSSKLYIEPDNSIIIDDVSYSPAVVERMYFWRTNNPIGVDCFE